MKLLSLEIATEDLRDPVSTLLLLVDMSFKQRRILFESNIFHPRYYLLWVLANIKSASAVPVSRVAYQMGVLGHPNTR